MLVIRKGLAWACLGEGLEQAVLWDSWVVGGDANSCYPKSGASHSSLSVSVKLCGIMTGGEVCLGEMEEVEKCEINLDLWSNPCARAKLESGLYRVSQAVVGSWAPSGGKT